MKTWILFFILGLIMVIYALFASTWTNTTSNGGDWLLSAKKIMVKQLLILRKIQMLSSSFSTCTIFNKAQFIVQICIFFFAMMTTIIGRFYYWERYHLYGCRTGYEIGFPIICPEFKRPSFIDLNTGLCYGIACVSIVVSTLIPIIFQKSHWKSILKSEILSSSNKIFEKNHVEQPKRKALQKLLLSLEHVDQNIDTNTTQNVEKRKFVIYLGSCIWSELYLLWTFKRKIPFVCIIIGMSMSIILPCLLALSLNGWSLLIGICSMLLFIVLPLMSGTLLVVFIACIASNNPASLTIAIIVCWCICMLTIIICSFYRERHDEISLVRFSYQLNLPLYVKDVKPRDVDLIMYIRGYGKFFL